MVKMRCKNYMKCRNRTASPHNKKCWRMWRLCGDCAVKEHPEGYSEKHVKRILGKMRNQNGS
jgi:hypothetical protein